MRLTCTIYDPFSAADGTILVGNGAPLDGQWQNTNYADLLDLGQMMIVQADITERYETVKNGPFISRPVPNPTRIPIPAGARVGVNGTDVYIVTLDKVG
jgi:hypothetical protein